jgi:hypothetical protein
VRSVSFTSLSVRSLGVIIIITPSHDRYARIRSFKFPVEETSSLAETPLGLIGSLPLVSFLDSQVDATTTRLGLVRSAV